MKQEVFKQLILVTTVVSVLFFSYSCDNGEDAQSNRDNAANATESAPAVLVETVRPIIQRVEHRIRAMGSFLPDDEVTISPEIAGKVKKIFVDEGYVIKKGQLLIQLDDKRQRLAVAEAEAKIRENEADLAYLETTRKRREELWKKKVISEEDYDEILSRVSMTKARTDSLMSALGSARKDMEDTRIYSPLDSIITEKMISEGEYVHVGETMFNAVKINPLKLRFTLPETHTALVRKGQPVKARVKAYPDREFSGKVYFINPQVDPTTRTVEIKAYFDNRHGDLKPGFFADVFLVKSANEKALVIPGEGVIQREGKHLIYVVHDGVARRRIVRIGEMMEGKVEIVSGLNPGELVVTSGNRGLEEGTPVKVLNTPAPPVLPGS